MSTVALVDLHRGDPIPPGSARVLRLPAWIAPSSQGSYWHQPRSAYLRSDREVERGLSRFVVDFWCGPSRFLDSLDLTTSTPPDELRCGTCVGRRLGFDAAEGCVFRPRDVFAIPKRCPSDDTDPADHRLCRWCGARVRASYGWWSSGLAQHAPGPLLAERATPCPRHGWSRIDQHGDRLVCGFYDCPHVAAEARPA